MGARMARSPRRPPPKPLPLSLTLALGAPPLQRNRDAASPASSLGSAKWVRVLIRCGDCRRDRRGRMGACCLRLSVCHSDECRWMDDVGWRCGQTHRHGHCQTLYFPPLVGACVGIQLWQGGPHRSSHSLTASHPPFLRRPWTIPSSPSQSARSLARSVVATQSSTLLFIHTCTAAGSAGCIAPLSSAPWRPSQLSSPWMDLPLHGEPGCRLRSWQWRTGGGVTVRPFVVRA